MWATLFAILQGFIYRIVPILLKIIRALKAVEIVVNLMRTIKASMKRILLKVDDLDTGTYNEHKVAAVVFDQNIKDVVEYKILESDQLDAELQRKFNSKDMIIVEE